MNIWHSVDKNRISPESFLVCIEISAGSKNKYELDKDTGALILDRILFTSTHYPQNYGFIPHTLSDDHDPLDVLVICSEPILPLSLTEAYPIGILEMTDGGEKDEKIIAICSHDPLYNNFKSIDDLPVHVSEEIVHFFKVYKELEHGKTTVVDKIYGVEKAKETIKAGISKYEEAFGEKFEE